MNRRTFLTASLGAAAWSATAHEAPPPEPVIDTHVHFWDPGHLRYAWLDNHALLNRPYLPSDYFNALGHYTVDALVFVQAACIEAHWMDEAAWVSELAKAEPRIRAIVASAPLELGDGVLPTLEALAANPLLRGIRRMLQSEQAPEFCLQPDFVRGVQSLAAVDFVCDLGVRRDQLGAVTQLVRQCPGVTFALNHMGVPDLRSGELSSWRADIKALASLPNVYCKVSGAVTAADHDAWTIEDLRPGVEHVLECFGFDRCAYGSDWPVILQAAPMPRWLDALNHIVAGCSHAERRQLFQTTAQTMYRVA